MVEKKTVGSRILQGFFVVILVILALSCLLPLLYIWPFPSVPRRRRRPVL